MQSASLPRVGALVSEPHLRLAGVTRLSVHGKRGPSDAFVFDPHRLALPCWAVGLESRPAATLVTLDRHFDLVPPAVVAPSRDDGLQALDEFARWRLDVRNYDHILAAMEAGLISDAVVVARFHPRGAFTQKVWTDRRGVQHRIESAPSLEAMTTDARALIDGADEVLLDIDLDCFTTPLVEDPTSVAPWTREEIASFFKGAAWDAVLCKARVLTLAREPFHCGGLIAAGALFAEAASVLFEEQFGADLP